MRWPIHRKIGIGIVVIGLAPLVYATLRIYSHNWEPLAVRVRLAPGEFQSPVFKTDRNGRYLISLTFNPLPDLTRQQCMMGVPVFPRECDAITQTVDFDWQIVSKDGGVAQSGSYKVLSYSGAEATFGVFQGKRGKRWRALLRIRRDAGELNATWPKLVVHPGGEYWEGLPELYGYSLLWAKTVGIFGLLWVLAPMCFQALNRRKQRSYQLQIL